MLLNSSFASKNYDLDYESLQPYFYSDYEEEEAVYLQQLQPPTPSEHIWKKFELLPTPPLSSLSPSTAGQLEMVTEFLGDDAVNQSIICDANYSQTFLKSIIIQDCMWSGFSAPAAAAWRLNSSYLQSAGAPPSKDLGLDTPPNSGGGSSSSCSESEDEDGDEYVEEEEEEEEEEEIVVVRVARRQAVKGCDPSPLETRHPSPHVLKPAVKRQPAVKRLKLESSNSSNSSSSSSNSSNSSSSSSSSSSGGGGGGSGGHSRVLKQISSNRKCPRTSDTEDYDYANRRYNTVLERQRRKELKLSFLALRDEIPEVAYNDKAYQMVILKKAEECIYSMQSDEQRLLMHKEQLRRKSELLKQTLAQMQGSRA